MQEIDGVLHFEYGLRLVEDQATENNLANSTITVTAPDGGVMTPRYITAPYSPITDFKTNANGVSPPCFLPLVRVRYDAGAGPFSVTSEDHPELAADAAAARSAAEAAVEVAGTLSNTVNQNVTLVQGLVAQVEALIASGGGGSGTAGGLYVVRAVDGAYPTTEAAALTAAAAAGPQPYFIGPRDVAPPSWIADGDPIGLTPPPVTP